MFYMVDMAVVDLQVLWAVAAAAVIPAVAAVEIMAAAVVVALLTEAPILLIYQGLMGTMGQVVTVK